MEQAQVSDHDDVTDPLSRMAQRHRVQAAQQGAALRAALSQAFGRMCAGYPGLNGHVAAVTRRTVSLAELVELTEPGMFLALLEGPGDGMGMVWLCPVALSALVEAQTTGQVLAIAGQSGTPRLPTRTDAALLAPMVDAFLHQIGERCADLPEADLLCGFLYGSFLDDRRPIGVVLEDEEYELFTMRVSLAQGSVTGTLTLVVPRPRAPVAEGQGRESDDWETRLATAVERSPVALNAVLCRFKLTLHEALGLTKGDILRVPDSALETLALAAQGGAQVAEGRLGQARGFRAVRLTNDPATPEGGSQRKAPALRLSKVAAMPPVTHAPALGAAPATDDLPD
jgi:flagellar motor switch protein FliM